MHLSICRVLHATGVGQEIDSFLHEIEDVDEPASVIERVEEWIMSNS